MTDAPGRATAYDELFIVDHRLAMETSKLDQLKIEREPEKEPRSWGWLWAILLLGLVVAAWLWWSSRPPPPIEIRTALARQVTGQAANTVLNASGYVTARRYATVSSKMTGQVQDVLIEEGMTVEQGQVLAYLDDANLRTSFELSKARLASSRSAVGETQALLKEAEANLRRSRNLVERELASVQELDGARAQAESLRARLQRVSADVTVAERQVAIFQQQLDDTVIRAPFAGVVVAKNAQPGEMISPNSAGGGFTRTGIGTIVDMSSLEIEIDVNEAYINRVSAGQRVMAKLDAYPDWEIPGHVIAIIPTADRQRATVEVRVGFDELDPRILPDMGIKVAFRGDDAGQSAATAAAASGGVLVPDNAVQSQNGKDYVWVVTNDLAERRAVSIGPNNNDDVLVTAGVQGGERVILNAPPRLVEGDQVAVTN